MNTEMHEKLALYVRNQLAQVENRLYAYTVNLQEKPYPQRQEVSLIEEYITHYREEGSEPRWITITGLRGVGKTTLMAQLYTRLQGEPNYKLYLSLDEITRVLGVGLQDVLDVYEEVLGVVFEKLEKPIYLFLDEVQYEEKWAAILKNMYDRSKKVFIITTGSAALLLQTDADVSRRMVVEKLYPLSFSEFLLLKEGKAQDKYLSEAIINSVFSSRNAEEMYTRLKILQKDVINYWLGVDRLAIDTYLRYATLPFA